MKWKNIGADTNTFFVTATITEWQPLFANDAPREILLSDIDFYRNKYNAAILAYVIMPEHYHLIGTLSRPEMLHDWLRDMQSHSSNEISKWLRQTMAPQHLELYARHANGASKLAVWKEQARAVGITTESVLQTKIAYVHTNPVKRGLVTHPKDWPWSSWRNYFLNDESILRVDRVPLQLAAE